MEMDDAELMNELNEIDEEGQQAAQIYIDTLKGQVEQEKLAALREKKANNIEKAKKHLAQMKQY